MKTELEQKDIQAIAHKVVEMIKPLLDCNGKDKSDDVIFDVPGLAKYLQVDESWAYKQVSLKTIPYFKAGKYTRFRKTAIDRWIDKESVRPIPPLRLVSNS